MNIGVNIENIWANWVGAGAFSGVFSVRDDRGILFEQCRGFRNKGERLPSDHDTAFGIASGTKLFTALAACKLIDAGLLSLDAKLGDLLPYDLGQIDRRVTVRHLLTHTSGIGDYLDEEDPDADEKAQQLASRYPLYLWERLSYYLPMIAPLAPKFAPGARFGYSNAGYIMLGLAIEAVSQKPYQQYVTDELIAPLRLRHTGFYPMDALPHNTAYGYVGERANIFSLPIVGGADGGLFSCAGDLDALWRALFAGRVLSKPMLDAFLSPQGGKDYGLGVYITAGDSGAAYYAVGCDVGVDFFTAYFPNEGITASALGNTGVSTASLRKALLAQLL